MLDMPTSSTPHASFSEGDEGQSFSIDDGETGCFKGVLILIVNSVDLLKTNYLIPCNQLFFMSFYSSQLAIL